MSQFAGIFVFASLCLAALGQTGLVPARWTGAWALNVEKSTFGAILVPGAPAGLRVVRQTLRIEQTATDIRLSSETAVSDGGVVQTLHDDNRLKFDGKATVIGPVSISFHRIDDAAFEITSTLDIPEHNLGEVSRFAFSSDGRTLTETKTQTEREVVPGGTDKSAGAVIQTSKSVLVFTKIPLR